MNLIYKLLFVLLNVLASTSVMVYSNPLQPDGYPFKWGCDTTLIQVSAVNLFSPDVEYIWAQSAIDTSVRNGIAYLIVYKTANNFNSLISDLEKTLQLNEYWIWNMADTMLFASGYDSVASVRYRYSVTQNEQQKVIDSYFFSVSANILELRLEMPDSEYKGDSLFYFGLRDSLQFLLYSKPQAGLNLFYETGDSAFMKSDYIKWPLYANAVYDTGLYSSGERTYWQYPSDIIRYPGVVYVTAFATGTRYKYLKAQIEKQVNYLEPRIIKFGHGQEVIMGEVSDTGYLYEYITETSPEPAHYKKLFIQTNDRLYELGLEVPQKVYSKSSGIYEGLYDGIFLELEAIPTSVNKASLFPQGSFFPGGDFDALGREHIYHAGNARGTKSQNGVLWYMIYRNLR